MPGKVLPKSIRSTTYVEKIRETEYKPRNRRQAMKEKEDTKQITGHRAVEPDTKKAETVKGKEFRWDHTYHI